MLALWLLGTASAAQDTPAEAKNLGALLADAEGRERLELLVEAAEQAKAQPRKVVDFASEALGLLETFADERLELRLLNALAQAHSVGLDEPLLE